MKRTRRKTIRWDINPKVYETRQKRNDCLPKPVVISSSAEYIESPMHMSYREAYAWQLGWDKGFKAGKESVTQHKLADSCKEVSDNTLYDEL